MVHDEAVPSTARRPEAPVLMSTLPSLPGQTFEVRGLVYAQGVLQAIGGDKIQNLIRSLVEQAEAIGADGIVDIHTSVASATPLCIVMGTAVKIQ